MAKYTVQNPAGKKVSFEWNDPNPPTDTDIEQVFAEAEKSTTTPQSLSPAPEAPQIPTGIGGGEAIARGLLPRSFKAAESGAGVLKHAGAGALDALSAPGRLVGSLNAPDKNSRMMPLGLGGAMIPVQSGAVSGNQAPDNGLVNAMADTEGKGFAQKMIRDPALIPSLAVGGPALGAAKGLGLQGLKAASAAGGLIGATSAGVHQADNAIQGKEISPLGAAAEVATGAALPFVAKGAGMVVHGGNKLLGKLAQEFSGVSEEALRMHGTGFGQGAKNLAEAAGKQHEIGQKLVKVLDNLDEYLPEKAVVDKALHEMPPVSVENTIVALQQAKKGGALASTRVTHDKIDGLIADLQGAADETGHIAAPVFRSIRKEIDDLVGDAFGKESGQYVSALKQARYQMADDLVKSAEASGVPEYVDAMKSMSTKLQTADKLKSFLGKSAQTRDSRAESFVSTLFGKNKTDRVNAVKAIEDIFGGDFVAEAKLANLAAELGQDGKAGILPRQFTGRAVLGPAVAAAGGSLINPMAAAPALALSSPRIAAGMLSVSGAADRLANRGVTAMEQIGANRAVKNNPYDLGFSEKDLPGQSVGNFERARVLKETGSGPLQLKKADPMADMYRSTSQIPQSGKPGLEGMIPPEVLVQREAEAQAAREAAIRQGRQVRLGSKNEPLGGVQILSNSDVAIRPRTPKGDIPSNFPPQYVENPKVAQVLDEVPGRRQLTTESDKIKGLKAELEAATTNDARQRILAKLRAENYRIPLNKIGGQ